MELLTTLDPPEGRRKRDSFAECFGLEGIRRAKRAQPLEALALTLVDFDQHLCQIGQPVFDHPMTLVGIEFTAFIEMSGAAGQYFDHHGAPSKPVGVS